ncbi:MAG TPA: replicative DNA helicase [Armatimonadota bacterium]|nr:replicative DNA helicase [Armatimonadota bacterium]
MDSQTLVNKIPPQNPEAEQSTLGSMMLERYAIEKAMEILRPEDFYMEQHRILFNAMGDMSNRNEPVDFTTLTEELRRTHRLEVVGGLPYLASLLHLVPTPANVEYYARIVQNKAVLRNLIGAGAQIQAWGYDARDREVDDLVDRSEQLIFAVGDRGLGRFFTPLGPILHEQFNRLDTLASQKTMVTGRATGYEDLDYMTSGFQPCDLVIIAARPSMGKTALAMSVATNIAQSEEGAVAVFSLEMSKEQLVLRLMCSEAQIDSRRLRTAGALTPDEWSTIANAVDRLWNLPLFIDDSTDITVMQMRAKCRRLKAEHGKLGLVVVDYLQLLRGARGEENRNQEISDIARGLKSLARELQVPVVALSQLSRNVERREDKRPMLSDLRESGSIEAEADVVAFIYRPSYYERKREHTAQSDGAHRPGQAEDAEETEIIIGKQRNGPTGTIKLMFIPRFAQFKDRDIYHSEV